MTNKPIGVQIARERARQGLVRAEVVKRAGALTEAALSRVESGDRYPSLKTLEGVVIGLNCEIVVSPEGVRLIPR